MAVSVNKKFKEDHIKLSDVVAITLRRWPWLVLSIVVCTGFAWLNAKRATPVYSQDASIMIKDDYKGSSFGYDFDLFQEMGFMHTYSNIIDEMVRLTSRDVITGVVESLNLNEEYNAVGRFHNTPLYGKDQLVKVSGITTEDDKDVSIMFALKGGNKYEITELHVDGEPVKFPEGRILSFGSEVPTGAGKITVSLLSPLKEDSPEKISYYRSSVKSMVNNCKKRLTVEQENEKGNIVNIRYTDTSIERARNFINMLIVMYNKSWADHREKMTEKSTAFINERLGLIENELGGIDSDISSFQSQNLIPDVDQAARLSMTERQKADETLMELNSQLQITQYMLKLLSNHDEGNRKVLPTNSGIQDLGIEKQITEYNTLLLQQKQFAANSSETHPIVKDLDMRLEGLRSSIIYTLDNKVSALKTQIRNVELSRNEANAQIASTPGQAKHLQAIERQQKIKEELYLFLLQRRADNEMAQSYEAYNSQIIAKPSGDTNPVYPNTTRSLMLGFIIGAIIPFGYTYIREVRYTKVRGKTDIDKLSAPFLGEIPEYHVQKGESKDQLIVVEKGSRNVINEAFRILRTNVNFMSSKDKKCTAIMVTSFNPGSGKSFISINFGATLAFRGLKVLIIDGDMRHASTSAYVNSPAKGLSNYLVGEVDDVKSLIVSDTIEQNLSILPVGMIPPNPTELLESERFDNLISSLRSEFDYIILDCPPLNMMADARIIEKSMDRTIFVIRVGLFERPMLVDLEKIIKSKELKNIGIVLNGSDAKAGKYGSKYGYTKDYENYEQYNAK